MGCTEMYLPKGRGSFCTWPITKKAAQALVGLPGILEIGPSSLGPVTQARTWEAASFGWSFDQEKTLQQVQVAMQATTPLGLCDPADLMVLEVSVADRDAVCMETMCKLSVQ